MQGAGAGRLARTGTALLCVLATALAALAPEGPAQGPPLRGTASASCQNPADAGRTIADWGPAGSAARSTAGGGWARSAVVTRPRSPAAGWEAPALYPGDHWRVEVSGEARIRIQDDTIECSLHDSYMEYTVLAVGASVSVELDQAFHLDHLPGSSTFSYDGHRRGVEAWDPATLGLSSASYEETTEGIYRPSALVTYEFDTEAQITVSLTAPEWGIDFPLSPGEVWSSAWTRTEEVEGTQRSTTGTTTLHTRTTIEMEIACTAGEQTLWRGLSAAPLSWDGAWTCVRRDLVAGTEETESGRALSDDLFVPSLGRAGSMRIRDVKFGIARIIDAQMDLAAYEKGADVSVTDLSVTPTTPIEGQPFDVEVRVRRDLIAAACWPVSLSGAGETLWAEAVFSGDETEATASFTATAEGDLILVARVDPNGTVDEPDEENNEVRSEIRVDRRPVFAATSPPPEVVARQGETVRFEVSVSDPDPGDAAAVAWTVDGTPAGSGSVLELDTTSYPVNTTVAVACSATDLYGAVASVEWTVTVIASEAAAPPRIVASYPASPVGASAGSAVEFGARVATEEPANATWCVDGATASSETIVGEALSVFSAAFAEGEHEVDFAVCAPSGSARTNWTVLVGPRELAVRFGPADDTPTLFGGDSLLFSVEVLDPVSGFSAYWSLDGAVVASGPEFLYRPGYNATGNHTVGSEVQAILGDATEARAHREWRVEVLPNTTIQPDPADPLSLLQPQPSPQTLIELGPDETATVMTRGDPFTLRFNWYVDGDLTPIHTPSFPLRWEDWPEGRHSLLVEVYHGPVATYLQWLFEVAPLPPGTGLAGVRYAPEGRIQRTVPGSSVGFDVLIPAGLAARVVWIMDGVEDERNHGPSYVYFPRPSDANTRHVLEAVVVMGDERSEPHRWEIEVGSVQALSGSGPLETPAWAAGLWVVAAVLIALCALVVIHPGKPMTRTGARSPSGTSDLGRKEDVRDM